MNNLVDLSSIQDFSSFNNIKQSLREGLPPLEGEPSTLKGEVGLTGGGKKFFYYTDVRGNPDPRDPVKAKISEKLNKLLEKENPIFPIIIKTSERNIIYNKDGSGTMNEKSFIGLDEELLAPSA